MAVQVQFRRGTKAQHDAFTGATAEITVNTTDITAHVHDGTTAGGFPLARADATNLDFTGRAGVTTFTSVAIHNGTINNTTIGIGTSANGNFTNVNIVDGQVGSALTVGAATTFKEDLVVNGNARVTGILTVGTGTIQIDGDNSTISGVDGGTFTDVTATTTDTQSLRAVAGVVTTLTSTNATIADLNVTADARVGSALTVSGDLLVVGNLTVEGTETIINVDRLDVQDKTIGVASTSTASNTTANGAGFFVHGGSDGDKEILWQSDTASFEVNQDWLPSADGTYDLGASGQEWQDLYVDGTANIDSLVADTADINAGTIDGTTIGGSSAAEGTFTNLTAADANITADARVGAALTVTGDATFQSDVFLGDSDRLKFGDENDLQIYHDGSNSYIRDQGTGEIRLETNNFRVRNVVNGETIAQFTADGSVKLYYDNAKKIETTAYGVDVTGTTGTDNLSVTGVSTFTGTIDVDGQAIFDDITVSAASTFTGAIDANGGANIAGGLVANSVQVSDLTDNRVVLAGTSGELEDSGNLTFDGTTLAVTGNQTVSGTIDVDGQAIFDDITVSAASTFTGLLDANGGATIDNVRIGVAGNNEIDTSTGNLTIDSAGGTTTIDDNASVSGTLGVTGTTTLTGALVANGNVDLGNATSDTITATGRFDSDLTPSTDSARDLGSTSLRWAEVWSDQVVADNIQIAVTGTNEIDTASGNLTIDSAGGTTTIDDALTVTGDATFNGTIDVDGQAIFDDITVSAASTFVGNAEFQSNVSLGDSDILNFGDGNDLQIYHNGTESIIRDVGTGNLKIRAVDQINLENNTGTETYANFINNGAVELYYDNSKKFETTAYGVDVTGTTGTDGLIVSGVSTFQGNVNLGDNDRIRFYDPNTTIYGTSQGLYVTASGNRDITIESNNSGGSAGDIQLRTVQGGKVYVTGTGGVGLYHADTSLKLETTSTGAVVTGTTGTDGLIVSGVTTTTGTLDANGNVTVAGTLDVDGQGIFDDITVSAASTFVGNVIAQGNVTINGDLIVEGTQTIINVDQLDVQDKTVGVASTSTASNTTANGGGFFVHGGSDGDKEILWQSDTASFEVNQSWLPSADNSYDLGASAQEWRNLYLDGTANIDSLVADTADINAGTIDNATIGGTTPAAGTFTDLKGGNVQVGTTGDNEIDTSSGNLTIDSAGGTTTIDDILSVSGNATFSGTIDVDGQAIFDDITVSAASTFTGSITASTLTASGDITANGNIVGDDSTNISGISSVTASTFFGDGSGLSNTGATLSAASGSQRVVLTSLTSGTMTSAATEAALAYNATSDTLTAGTFSGSGASLTSIPNGALDNSTISGVSLGSNLNTLTRGSYLTGSNYNGSSATTWAVDATNANTASKIVARDASGNFSANIITASQFSGNATSASTLQTARTINGVSFDGSTGITVEPYVEDDAGTNATRYLTFVDSTTAGYKRLNEDANLSYNPSSNVLTAGTFSGSGASLTSIPNGALDNSTISGTSLGSNFPTLYLATSGTGLSGSTQYNGTSGTTFTVTSNATNSNTASTIVARDSSGNFSAGTITATLSGTASNANTLDSLDSSQFLRSDSSDSATERISFSANSTNNWDTIATATGSQGAIEIRNDGVANDAFMAFHSGGDYAFYFGLDASTNDLAVGGWSMGANKYKVWHQNNDGSGSGLDADTVDGVQASSFLRSDAADTKTSGNLGFSDNVKATFGTGNDLEIFHDGSSSNIKDVGTGNLQIFADDLYILKADGSETKAQFNSNGNVRLFYDSFEKLATTSGGIQVTGTVTATSDIKLKENVTTIENGLDKISQLRGVEFDFKSNGQHSLGVIAQEVEQVLPDLVTTNEEGIKSVAYGNLTAVLIEAVKELKAEVAELRARLDG